MAYDFLDADGDPGGPAAELKKFLKEYRESASQPSEPPQEAPSDPFTQRVRDAIQSKFGRRRRAQNSLGWNPGTPGKGLVLDGQVHTWPVDDLYMPNHWRYMEQRGLVNEGRPDWSRTSGPYVVINPEGDIHSATVREGEDITPFLQADARLKPPVVHSGDRTLDQLDDVDWQVS